MLSRDQPPKPSRRSRAELRAAAERLFAPKTIEPPEGLDLSLPQVARAWARNLAARERLRLGLAAEKAARIDLAAVVATREFRKARRKRGRR